MQAEVKSLFRKMPSWKSNIIWQQKRESEQAAVISEKITLCIHKYIYAKCSTFSRDGEWTETAVCAWDSWTSIQALRKVGRMQRSRCVCLTLSACSVSVGKWAIPPPSKSCSNLCQPAAACRRAEQASSSHQRQLGSAHSCRGTMEQPPHRNMGVCPDCWLHIRQIMGSYQL